MTYTEFAEAVIAIGKARNEYAAAKVEVGWSPSGGPHRLQWNAYTEGLGHVYGTSAVEVLTVLRIRHEQSSQPADVVDVSDDAPAVKSARAA